MNKLNKFNKKPESNVINKKQHKLNGESFRTRLYGFNITCLSRLFDLKKEHLQEKKQSKDELRAFIDKIMKSHMLDDFDSDE